MRPISRRAKCTPPPTTTKQSGRKRHSSRQPTMRSTRLAAKSAALNTDSHKPHHADGRTTRVLNTVGYPGSVLTDVPVMRTVGVIPRSTIIESSRHLFQACLTHLLATLSAGPATLPIHPHLPTIMLSSAATFNLTYTPLSNHQPSPSPSAACVLQMLLPSSVVSPHRPNSEAVRAAALPL